MSTSDDQESSPTKTDAEYVSEIRDTVLPLDPNLAQLVSFINLMDSVEIGITLHVNGTAISGMLISVTQFYRLLIAGMTDPERLSERTQLDDASSFARFFRPNLESNETTLAHYRSTKTIPPMPQHLHLRHAQTYVTASEPLGPTLWRGRLTEVDGWSVGNFGIIPELPDHLIPPPS